MGNHGNGGQNSVHQLGWIETSNMILHWKNIHYIISHRIHGIYIFPYMKMVDNVDKYTHGYSEFGAFDFFPSMESTSNDSVGFAASKPMRFICASERIPASWQSELTALDLCRNWGKLGEKPSKKTWRPTYESMTMHTNRSLKIPASPKTAPETSVFTPPQVGTQGSHQVRAP